jgi:hypothetical protein
MGTQLYVSAIIAVLPSRCCVAERRLRRGRGSRYAGALVLVTLLTALYHRRRHSRGDLTDLSGGVLVASPGFTIPFLEKFRWLD